MTYEEWIDEFKPVRNTINKNSAYDGMIFETYGDELEHVRNTPSDRIWTLLDEDGYTWISNGFHFVNRLGYLITEKPAPDEHIEIIVGEPRYKVHQFDESTFQVLDTENGLEVAVCTNYDDVTDAKFRADAIVDRLNNDIFDWIPS